MSYYKLVDITPINRVPNKKSRYLSLAVDIAETSNFTSSKKLGAIFEINGKIFEASNLKTVLDGEQFKDRTTSPSLHAEINVIQKTIKNLGIHKNQKKCSVNIQSGTLYVVRLLKNVNDIPSYRKYKFGISKPCINCQQLLYKYGVSKIFYTDIIEDLEVLCELRSIKT